MIALRAALAFVLIGLVRLASRIFYRAEVGWVGTPPPDPWSGIRAAAILNHTSLYEPLFAVVPPTRFIWQIARHGVIPVAEKTMKRPLVGTFFRFLAPHVVSITRKRDHTWEAVLGRLEEEALIVLLPEGRMKRANGLDLRGRPMDVRAGIADVIRAVPDGRLLLAYSGGLHHVQVPGEHFPRLFKTIRLNLEILELEAYRGALLEEHGEEGFTDAVRADLERRRDRNCPPERPS